MVGVGGDWVPPEPGCGVGEGALWDGYRVASSHPVRAIAFGETFGDQAGRAAKGLGYVVRGRGKRPTWLIQEEAT